MSWMLYSHLGEKNFLHELVKLIRKFEIDGKFWIERVSTVPSTRLDLLALQEKFENCLKLNGAKPFGVCPIRRRIYDQLFGR